MSDPKSLRPDADHLRALAERLNALSAQHRNKECREVGDDDDSHVLAELHGRAGDAILALLNAKEGAERERDEWQQAGTDAMDRCRETHGKHFLLVGGMLGSGDGTVPSVPFHEQAICEPELATLRARLALAERVVEEARRAVIDIGGDNDEILAASDRMRDALAELDKANG